MTEETIVQEETTEQVTQEVTMENIEKCIIKNINEIMAPMLASIQANNAAVMEMHRIVFGQLTKHAIERGEIGNAMHYTLFTTMTKISSELYESNADQMMAVMHADIAERVNDDPVVGMVHMMEQAELSGKMKERVTEFIDLVNSAPSGASKTDDGNTEETEETQEDSE